jgi:voltage-gated potassium channel Kch
VSGDTSGLGDAVTAASEPDAGSRRFVVWGDNALARRLVGELMDRYNAQVTAIVAAAGANQAPEIVDLEPASGDPAMRPVVVVAPRLSPDVFRHAGLAEAAALALVDQDDVANVDAALIAREVNPTVRIVVRMFNPILGEGIAAMLGDCEVLSGSEIAAPAFVAAALGDGTPTYVRLPDEFLTVAKRSDLDNLHPDDVVCGLAITEGLEDPAILPEEEDAADLVLVRAYGGPPQQRRRRRSPSLRFARLLFGRKLRLALAGLTVLLAVGTATLAAARHIGPWQAAYLTLMTAIGGANADLDVPVAEQVVEVLLAILGVALIPALTALVVEVVINARLARNAGGLTEPVSGHVIVVGLGNVGTRVIRELHDFGLDVVGIDRSAHARGVPAARDLGIPVVIGSANSTETLRAASVKTCRALVVVSTDDVTNLETALLGRAIHAEHEQSAAGRPSFGGTGAAGKLRVVLRLGDEDFAGRVKRAFDIDSSRSVSYLSAPAFAAAMVGREVIGTISVGRRVLLVAELSIGAGSQLEGKLCPAVSCPHEVRLIAVRGRYGQTFWSRPDRRKLVRTEQILVVATRAGLGALLLRTAGVPNPPPIIEPEPLRLLTLYGQRTGRHDQPAEQPHE